MRIACALLTAIEVLTCRLVTVRAQSPEDLNMERAALDPGGGLPKPPLMPQPTSRPSQWPGAENPYAGGPAPSFDEPVANSPPSGAPVAEYDVPMAQPYERGQIVARVGSEVILAADVLGPVDETIARNGEKIPTDQVEEVRRAWAKQLLTQLIESKLVLEDALRTIPAENLPKIEEEVNEQFELTQVPKLMENSGATSRADLDTKMQASGVSLERQRRLFFERALASQWLQEQTKGSKEIQHSQILSYYQQNLKDYEYPAQATWEELMVRFDKFPSKAAAYSALAELGNQVQGGAEFATVAKSGSHGPTAAEGGRYEPVTQGALADAILDQAVFGLPTGAMSQILETKRGFHIVRVVERHDAGRTPFTEAQVEIRKTMREEDDQKRMDDYLGRLRKRTPVWTIYDGPAVGATVAERSTAATPQ